MNKQLAKLSVKRSADYYDEVVKTLEDAGFVLVLETETSTDRYYIVAKSEDKKEIAIKSSTIEEPKIDRSKMTKAKEVQIEGLLHIRQIEALTAKDREVIDGSILILDLIPYIFNRLRNDISEYGLRRLSFVNGVQDSGKVKDLTLDLDYVLGIIDNIQKEIESKESEEEQDERKPETNTNAKG